MPLPGLAPCVGQLSRGLPRPPLTLSAAVLSFAGYSPGDWLLIQEIHESVHVEIAQLARAGRGFGLAARQRGAHTKGSKAMTYIITRLSGPLSANMLLGFVLAVLTIVPAAGDDIGSIQFDTDFDSGGGVSVHSRTETHFTLTLEDEQNYGPLGYMHFRLRGVEGETVSFEFTNLGDSRMPSDYRLLYSETPLEELDYQRMDEAIGDGFSQEFQSDTVYIANYFPFPYQNTVEQVTRHQDCEYVTVELIGQSHEGRDMYAMRISDPDVPDDEKRDIVALTRQHPGETTGSYQMDGMIAYVLEVFRDETRAFDEDYRFHFLPHANPDGIYRGIHRLCSQGYDLNRQWDSDSPVEIRNLKDYMERNVTNAWWGFDLHATTNRTFTSLFYTPAATERYMAIVESMAAHIVSLDGVGSSTASQQARGYYHEGLGGSMVVTEKWLYSEDFDVEFLHGQGRSFLREVVARPSGLRVAIFSGASSSGIDAMSELVASMPNAAHEVVSAEDIREGALDSFDIAVFAGGSGTTQGEQLEEEGRKAVLGFVEGGGSYLGICAGAYLASSRRDAYLAMLPYEHHLPWALGSGYVDIEITASGRELLDNPDAGIVNVRYNNGPIFLDGEGGAPDLEADGYEVLAYFRSAVNDDSEVMVDMPAIVAGDYGAGRFILVSPHPETLGDTHAHWIIENSLKHLAAETTAASAQ